MRNLKRQRVWRNIMQSKPVLILLGILILFFAWNVLRFWNKMDETAKNKKIVEDKVAALTEQKNKLSSEINSLETDEGKEKFFRENLGLAKEGEGLIIVVDDKNVSQVPLEANTWGFFSFFENWFK